MVERALKPLFLPLGVCTAMGQHQRNEHAEGPLPHGALFE
jgi:hypothetical protein